ncbi:putative trithorax group protein osa-like [Triplophysa rosa]|uniref:Trithorax group protein osa-like n=1 Tax=Triplophysa rosa TaxID=992332 RepID=A0A9W8C7I8_TRIRA|nr:putative trithorax group protein osa-like [Triplophysa rosa]
MNEWHPLTKASAKCGYSLVSHPDGIVIHVPYMPCTEAKDGMFSLTMAKEKEFNLSCPALSLSLPITESDHPSKNDTSISSSLVSSTLSPIIITSVETTKPTESQTTSTSSTMQKLFPAPLPYHIPGHPYFQPVSPFHLFLLFHPNVPPTVAPQVVVTPLPITQGPQTPVYPKPYDPKPPQTWYPNPNLVPAPDPTRSLLILPPRESLLPPTEVPKTSLNPLVYLLKPKCFTLQDKTTHGKPPVPVYPPGKLVYPFYSEKPGFDTTSVALGQVPQWLYTSQTRQRPDDPLQLKPSEQHASPKPELAPPTPAPTRKVEPLQLLHFPWYKPFPRYKPFPQQHLEMPSVPTKVPHGTEAFPPYPQPSMHPDYSDTKGPPLSMHFDLSNALSFHCPTFCPGPPSISYHHHNYHHFGHPFPVPYLGSSRHAKLTEEIQSSPAQPPGTNPFPFIQGMGYNYSPYSSNVEALPSATQYVAPTESPVIKTTRAPESEPLIRPTKCPYIFRTLASNLVSFQSAVKPANIPHFVHPWPTKPISRSSQNAPIAESVAHSVQSPKLTLYQAEMQHYISQWRQHMPTFAAPHSAGPFSQSQHEVSLKPTTSPVDDNSLSNNYWYQAASYPRPPTSDAPAEISKQASVNNDHNSLQSTTPSQPKQTQDVDPLIQLNVHPSMQIRDSVPVHTQVNEPQNGEPSVPIFRDPEPFSSYWVPAVLSNQKTVHSTHYPDGKSSHSLTVL